MEEAGHYRKNIKRSLFLEVSHPGICKADIRDLESCNWIPHRVRDDKQGIMNPNLKKILKGVSRSFYLSYQLCPHKMKDTIGLSFLFCKIADTIADTELLSANDRLGELKNFRQFFLNKNHNPNFHFQTQSGGSAAEKELLQNIPACFEELTQLSGADQATVYWLVPELTNGMITDLSFFGTDTDDIKCLPDEASLEQYTYDVAGCVGRFWTKVLRNNFSFAQNWPNEVEDIGESFGKGLQLVNILRDLPQDLLNGRCYLPLSELDDAGLKVEQFLDKEELQNVRPILKLYLEKARRYLEAGRTYANFFPRYALRLRASVLLPMDLGFKTLTLLENSPDWLAQNKVIKIERKEVYKSLVKASFA